MSNHATRPSPTSGLGPLFSGAAERRAATTRAKAAAMSLERMDPPELAERLPLERERVLQSLDGVDHPFVLQEEFAWTRPAIAKDPPPKLRFPIRATRRASRRTRRRRDSRRRPRSRTVKTRASGPGAAEPTRTRAANRSRREKTTGPDFS